MIDRHNYKHDYVYDQAGRLLEADHYAWNTAASPPEFVDHTHSLNSNYEYDLNGNIKTIHRDNLWNSTDGENINNTFGHGNTNRLINSVKTPIAPPGTPTVTNYSYDDYGNLTDKEVVGDSNKDVEIHWTADGKIDYVVSKFLYAEGSIYPHKTYYIFTKYYYNAAGERILKITDGTHPDSPILPPQPNPMSPGDWLTGSDSLYFDCWVRYNDDNQGHCESCMNHLGSLYNIRYYGKEAGGKTLALYDGNYYTFCGQEELLTPIPFAYKELELDEWYIYGSGADGRISRVKPQVPNLYVHDADLPQVNGEFENRESNSETANGPNQIFYYTSGSRTERNFGPPELRNFREQYPGTNSTTFSRHRNIERQLGYKSYEIKDHLGNIRAVVDDWKQPADFGVYEPYKAQILNISNYNPYGKPYIGGMQYSADTDYNYAFNGKENESGGLDGNLDFGARVYNSEVGSFLSRDPLESNYKYKSTYTYASNNPILFIDKDGEDTWIYFWEFEAGGGIALTESKDQKTGLYMRENRLNFNYMRTEGRAVDNIGITRFRAKASNFGFNESDNEVLSFGVGFDIGHSVLRSDFFLYNVKNNKLNLPSAKDVGLSLPFGLDIGSNEAGWAISVGLSGSAVKISNIDLDIEQSISITTSEFQKLAGELKEKFNIDFNLADQNWIIKKNKNKSINEQSGKLIVLVPSTKGFVEFNTGIDIFATETIDENGNVTIGNSWQSEAYFRDSYLHSDDDDDINESILESIYD